MLEPYYEEDIDEYKEYKENHIRMWDGVISELEDAKINFYGVPEILPIKQGYCDSEVFNSCFACDFARTEAQKKGDFDKNYCCFCPLTIVECYDKRSPYEQLLALEDTDEYDKAIALAKEIRDSFVV